MRMAIVAPAFLLHQAEAYLKKTNKPTFFNWSAFLMTVNFGTRGQKQNDLSSDLGIGTLVKRCIREECLISKYHKHHLMD
jgi:hypothetical protein